MRDSSDEDSEDEMLGAQPVMVTDADVYVETRINGQPLLKNCKPMRHDLLRNRDGCLGAILSDGEWFLTTPNADVLYEPPIGDRRKVVIRRNNMYGADDPLLWPQLFCAVQSHFACIPRPPDQTHTKYTEHSYMFGFGSLAADEVTFRRENNSNNKGRLTAETIRRLQSSIDSLRIRTRDCDADRKVLEPTGRRVYLDLQLRLMDLGMLFLQSSEARVTDLHRYVIEIKRAWIYSIAWLDYMTTYRRNFSEELPPSNSINHCMGCITLDPLVVGRARAAGIPVWLMQPESDFADQNILRRGTVLLIDQQLQSPPVFPSPILHLGRNGDSNLYKNLLKASQRFLSDDAAEFISKPPPSRSYDTQPDIDVDMESDRVQCSTISTSSTQNVPASSLVVKTSSGSVDRVDRSSRKHLHNAAAHPYNTTKERPVLRWEPKNRVPEVEEIVDDSVVSDLPKDGKGSDDNPRSAFEDLNGPHAPDTLKAFAGANLTIKIDSLASQARAKKHPRPIGYAFPPPHVIDHTTEKWANIYIKSWNHIRHGWIFNVGLHSEKAVMLSVAEWRAMLSLGSWSDERWTQPPPKKKTQLKTFTLGKELRQLLQKTMELSARERPTLDVHTALHPFDTGHQNAEPLTPDEGGETLYHLAVLNFRFDLVMLDMYFALDHRLGPRSNRSTGWPFRSKQMLAMINRHILLARCWCLYSNKDGGHLFSLNPIAPNKDWANPHWNVRVPFVQALHSLICTWPVTKPPGFLNKSAALGPIREGSTGEGIEYSLEDVEKIEREVICFYCQTFFDVFGRPPVLHYKSKFVLDDSQSNFNIKSSK